MKKIAALMVCLQAASWGMDSSWLSSGSETRKALQILRNKFSDSPALEAIKERDGFGCKILQCVNAEEVSANSGDVAELFIAINAREETGGENIKNTNTSIFKAFANLVQKGALPIKPKEWRELLETEWLENEVPVFVPQEDLRKTESDLKKQIEQLERELKNAKKTSAEENAKILNLKIEIKDLKDETKSCKQDLLEARKSNFVNRTLEAKLNEELGQTEDDLIDVKESNQNKIAILTIDLKKRAERDGSHSMIKNGVSIKTQDAEIRKLEETIQRLEDKKNVLEKNLEETASNYVLILSSNEQLEEELTTTQNALKVLCHQSESKIESLKTQLKTNKERDASQSMPQDAFSTKEKDFKARLKTLQSENQSFNSAKITCKHETERLKKDIRNLAQECEESQSIIQHYTDTQANLEQNNADLTDVLNNVNVEKRKLLAKNLELRETLQSKNLKVEAYEELKQRNTKLEGDRRKLKEEIRNLQISLWFPGEILDRWLDQKKYLLETLESHYKFTIKSTDLIYTFDPLRTGNVQQINFHKYIDHHPNIVVVVEVESGAKIAAYSESGFIPNTPFAKDGLLISLTNREYFTLAEKNRRAITYDDFYLIFGNSELRIKESIREVFSNFGISNGYYQSRNHKADVLLGGGLVDQREVKLIGYEVYQLQLAE